MRSCFQSTLISKWQTVQLFFKIQEVSWAMDSPRASPCCSNNAFRFHHFLLNRGGLEQSWSGGVCNQLLLQYPPQSACPFAQNNLQLLLQTLCCCNTNVRPQRPSPLSKGKATRGDEDKGSFFPRSQEQQYCRAGKQLNFVRVH